MMTNAFAAYTLNTLLAEVAHSMHTKAAVERGLVPAADPYAVNTADGKPIFKRFMQEKEHRLQVLRSFLTVLGIDMDWQVASLDAINIWLIRWLKPQVAAGMIAATPQVRSVCDDIAIYLGEMVIKADPTIAWKRITARRAVYYNRPALVNKNYEADPGLFMAVLVCRGMREWKPAETLPAVRTAAQEMGDRLCPIIPVQENELSAYYRNCLLHFSNEGNR